MMKITKKFAYISGIAKKFLQKDLLLLFMLDAIFLIKIKNIKKTSLYMHRLILGLSDKSIIVDHINNNGLDNRKENLRICFIKENRYNSRKVLTRKNKATSSKYRGVYKVKDKYRAMGRLNGIGYNLGIFYTEIGAAIMYDIFARKFFGEYAKLNFSTDSDIPEFYEPALPLNHNSKRQRKSFIY